MNKLDTKEIVRNAIDGSTYSKAYELFLNKKVVLQCRRNEFDEDVYEGVVTGNSNKSYQVTAVVNRYGRVTKATCQCDYYESYVGYCKHILAFLLQINELTNKKETDELSLLLSYYKKYVSLDIEIDIIFHVFKNDVGVELKIGKDKKYIIKNLNDFYDNLEHNFSFKYGKDLEFIHSLSAFDKKSKAILEDLQEYIDYFPNEPKNYFDGKRKCKIPKIVFKKLLDINIDHVVELMLNDVHYEVVYTKEPIVLDYLFENDSLSLKNKKELALFNVGRSYYIIKDSKLYCLDNLPNPQVIPLINTLFNTAIVFNNKTYNDFFTYIYPQVKDEIHMDNKEEFETNNKSSKLDVESYLDLKDGKLYLNYKFFYDGMDRKEALTKGCYPNIALEDNFLDQLSLFSFIRTPRENEYVIDDWNWAIDFLKNDIEKLKEYTKVYVSDTIKNISFKKITSSLVGIRYNNNWLEIFFNDTNYSINEINEILDSIKKKKKYHLLKDGTILNLYEKNFVDLANVVDNAGLEPKQIKKEVQLPLFKLVQLESFIENSGNASKLNSFLHDLKSYKFINYPLAPSLKPILRDYQKEGFRWLYNLAYYKTGGVLADDMGLGKTLEVISLIKSFKTTLPNLIVAPASLTYNWYNEFKKWDKNMPIILISGNGQIREDLIKRIQPAQTIITSYDYLKRDLELYKELKFHFMIIDEAQNIKNYTTKNAESVKEINAVSRFALTGTPIENTLADLWSIFDFCLPGYLLSYESFKYKYEYEIIKNNNKEALSNLTKQIAPFIIRRTKKEVLKELPEKVEQVIYAKMNEEQEKFYQSTISNAKKQLLSMKSTDRMYIFTMLTRLRQLCCHPKLYIENYEGESAKLNLTMDLIENSIAGNHKILLFSQFTSMLSIIENELLKAGIPYLKLTGNTPSQERSVLVDKFNSNEDIKIFLISLKAGGTGLNLVSADTVIHYDPWWNISAETQASDRVHRIGQKKVVQVYKVIAKDSIEEKILNLQSKKKDLFDRVISDDTSVVSKLTNEELLSLFNYE